MNYLDYIASIQEEVFEDCDQQITDNEKFQELECWDSITALSLIAFLSENFNKEITADNLESIGTLKELYDYISS